METTELGGVKPSKPIDSQLSLSTSAPVKSTCNCIKAPCNCASEENPIKETLNQSVSGIKAISAKVVQEVRNQRIRNVVLVLGAVGLTYLIFKKK